LATTTFGKMSWRDKTPAPLNLSQAKFLVPSPRMNLRRAASYNNEKYYSRSPLSATSSRFNFNHLLFTSPPPSPSLPALVPRPRKSPTHPRPSRIFRSLLWVAFLFLILYVVTITTKGNGPVSIPYLAKQPEFEMVGQDELPDFATPIVVSDTSGQFRWTVSIPANADFPLPVDEYTEMCSKCREAAARVREVRGKNPPPQQTSLGRESPSDKYFVDVPDAETSGLLPGISTPQKHLGNIIGDNYQSFMQKPICDSSMTFVLETADAGIGNTMMELWVFYGLALKQGRAFFIDDSRWAYGRYTDMFQPPPVPDCRPPPRHHMVPCPAQARHIIVSSATARELWSESLSKPYERRSSYDRATKDIFRLASEGYRALFTLSKDDAAYVERRVKDLRTKAAAQKEDGAIIGMHIRHGDRHPLEYQYRSSYIPTEVFTERAQSIAADVIDSTDGKTKQRALMVVASDDPSVYDAEELAGAERAQERIRLAGKQDVQQEDGKRNARVMHHFVDESFGWEGGFFGPMFWNLGLESMSVSNAATAENKKLPPSEETLRLRSYMGRAYLMDLAVLAGASDRVLCTVSAMGCRLLAVMMGWERAMGEEAWVNVDGDFGWTALTW
jgi:hypothetical protein